MYDFWHFWDQTNSLPVIERCPYYRGVRKERLDCIKGGKNSELKVSLNYEKDLYFPDNKPRYIAYKYCLLTSL